MAKRTRSSRKPANANYSEYTKWTWDAALAAAVLAAIAVVVAVMALPQERIKAIEEFGVKLVQAKGASSNSMQTAASLSSHCDARSSRDLSSFGLGSYTTPG